MGYAVATPSILSILQSCKQEISIAWVPEFYSLDEAKMIEGLADLIIPKTDIPGAKELNVPMFIDRYTNEVVEKDEAKRAKEYASLTFKELGGSTSVEKYIEILDKYLKTTDEQINSFSDDEKKVSKFVKQIRELSVWGFKTSEEIGENVMAYDPVPGGYIACGSLDELTKGKAWSL